MRVTKGILFGLALLVAAAGVLILSMLSTRSYWQVEWAPPDVAVDLKPKWPDLKESEVPPDSAFGLLRRAADAEAKVARPTEATNELSRLNSEPWSEQSFPALRAMLNQSSEALKLARLAAVGPNPQVPTYTSPADRFDYLQPVMHLHEMLLASAARNTAAGNFQAAFDDYDTSIADARILSRGGVLIHTLVDVTNEMRTCRAMRLTALQHDLPSEVSRGAIDKILKRSGAAEPLDNTFRQEYRAIPTIVNMLFRSSNQPVLPLGNDPEAIKSERRFRSIVRYFGWIMGSSPAQITADLTRVYKHLVATSAKPYSAEDLQWLDKELVPSLESRDWRMRRDPAGYLIAKLTVPIFVPVIARYHRRALELNATAAVLAVRQFQVNEHRTPVSLGELVPRYLEAIPIDSFDGKPLKYRIGPDGKWIIYSVGPNQIDEGGVQPKRDPRNYTDAGDLVFSELEAEVERNKAAKKGP